MSKIDTQAFLKSVRGSLYNQRRRDFRDIISEAKRAGMKITSTLKNEILTYNRVKEFAERGLINKITPESRKIANKLVQRFSKRGLKSPEDFVRHQHAKDHLIGSILSDRSIRKEVANLADAIDNVGWSTWINSEAGRKRLDDFKNNVSRVFGRDVSYDELHDVIDRAKQFIRG